jgi:hypothetical protein
MNARAELALPRSGATCALEGSHAPQTELPRMILFSVRDLEPIRRGGDAAQAFRRSLVIPASKRICKYRSAESAGISRSARSDSVIGIEVVAKLTVQNVELRRPRHMIGAPEFALHRCAGIGQVRFT